MAIQPKSRMDECAVDRYNAFSYKSFQHHAFLTGRSDFHNDVIKMEIMKKIVKQPLDNYKFFCLIPLLKAVTILLCSL